MLSTLTISLGPHSQNPGLLLFLDSSSVSINSVSTRNARSAVVAAAGTRLLMGSLTRTEGLRFAVVASRFNEVVTNLLLEGALETFRRYSVREEDITIRGDTTHYDAVANSAASGVLSAGMGSGVPCILGILTCENLDKALNRADGKSWEQRF